MDAIWKAVWGPLRVPRGCENCETARPVIFIMHRDPPAGLVNPIYLCRPCYQRLVIESLQRHGRLVIDLPQLFDELETQEAQANIDAE